MIETRAIRPRRSALYMPGSNERALRKAAALPADVVILDLEDSVAPEEKRAARDRVVEAVRAREFGSRETVVRINGLETAWGRDDLAAVRAAAPDAVLVPKVDGLKTLTDVQAILGEASATGIWAMMETPRAILAAGEIGTARQAGVPGLSALVLGTNDLAKETRMRLLPDRAGFLPWLTTCLAAARAGGLDILDSVFNDIDDEVGLAAECRQGADLGFDGKTLIHPRQIEACNAAFSPSEADIAWARRIADIFDEPENTGRGVVRVDGKMVERLHAEMARRTLALAEAARE